MRVLIVDDDPKMLSAARRCFRGDYEVHEANSALGALDLLNDLEDVDVVLSDYAMEGEHGLWLLERVRERCEDAHRLLMSASNEQMIDGLEYALNAGTVHAFMNKADLYKALKLALPSPSASVS